jgi:surface polysaccharide O-acyltransferase-like enzyme
MGTRKYFLDWLRVLAFAMLVFFHIGMLYVTWGYNLKSPRIYPAIEWGMEAISPWRMPLLFVISGVACRFLIGKLGAGNFALNRLARLGLVVVTGMLLVNPLQVWVQLISQGDTAKGYFDFWTTSYLVSDPTYIKALGRPMPTWDHLWFLVYLLNYTLIFACVFALLPNRKRRAVPLWMFFVLPAVWMATTNVLMGTIAPFTHALINDWAAHLKWFGLFAVGAMLANRDDFWTSVRDNRRRLAFVAVTFACVYLSYRLPWIGERKVLAWTVFYRCAEGAFSWSAVLAIVGYAAHFLDRPSAQLRYLNDAVLPIYVLHQPILLTAAFLVFPLNLPIGIEMLALVIATAVGPLMVYHLAIRPWRPVRWLFGLKVQRHFPSTENASNTLLPLPPTRAAPLNPDMK